MQQHISVRGEDYILATDYRDNGPLRSSFNALTQRVYGFDFEQWYQDGYWQEDYLPYSILDGETVVANVSVNILDFLICGEQKRYIQLGTVMTDDKYRNRGLSRALMERVINDWQDKCDMIYLFANDSVLDFYPKFGFVRAYEHQYSKLAAKKQPSAAVRQMDMSSEAERRLLINAVSHAVPISTIAMLNNVSLIMFYCTSFMKDNVYFIDELDTAVIAEYAGDTLLLNDIFCPELVSLDSVINAMLTAQTQRVVLGFTPLDGASYEFNQTNIDGNTLFISTHKENPFASENYMFPVLSHT